MERKIEQHLMRNLLAENSDFKLHLLNSGYHSLALRYERRLAADDHAIPEAYAHNATTRLLRMALELKADIHLLESLCEQPPKELTDLYQQHVNGMHRHAMNMTNNIVMGHVKNNPSANQQLLVDAMRSHAMFHRRFEALQSIDFFEDCNAWHDTVCETFAIEKLLPRIAELDVFISEEIQMMGYQAPEIATSFADRLEKASRKPTKKLGIVPHSVSAAQASGENVIPLFPRDKGKG